MKYPVNTSMLTEARMYARESCEHTMNYKGWEDAYKKMERIITGKFCQLWLTEFCRVNTIPHVKDSSSPYVADTGDLFINGWNIDCKGTAYNGFEFQISPHLMSQDEIDLYFFFRTSRQFDYVEPLGCIRREQAIEVANHVKKGEEIPGTGKTQSFKDGSYFIDREYLISFQETIIFMKNNAKKIEKSSNVTPIRRQA